MSIIPFEKINKINLDNKQVMKFSKIKINPVLEIQFNIEHEEDKNLSFAKLNSLMKNDSPPENLYKKNLNLFQKEGNIILSCLDKNNIVSIYKKIKNQIK